TPRSGVDLKGMDPSVKPYADFYQYANGKWLETTTIPADKPSILTFTQLQDHNRDVLHEILEDLQQADAPKDGIAGKVGSFYRSGMDERRIDEPGAEPRREEIDRIAAVQDVPGLLAAVAHLHGYGLGVAFRLGAQPDLKDSSRMIATLHQGGLSLPDRDYYLKDDDKTKAVRTAYREHVEKML